jgi:adenylyl-sulfate kinase
MKSIVIWLTGLSGAGKSTTATVLHTKFIHNGYQSVIADADTMNYRVKLGFDIESRKQAVNIMIYTVRNLIEFQKTNIVIVSCISPLQEMRDLARHIITKYSDAQFYEVFVNTPIEICEQRDPKYLYKKYREGFIRDMSGLDSPYEAPLNPDINLLYTADTTPEINAEYIFKKVVAGT